jgi:hypothetical protein
MISVILVICGLVIAFIEKPHLFQRPIKPAKVVVVSILVVTAIFSYCKEHNTEVAQDRSEHKIDSINHKADSLEGLTSDLRLQIKNLVTNSKKSQMEYVDSLINYHNYTTDILAKYGYKVDTLNNTLTKLNDKVIKETPPTLTILSKPKLFTSDSLGAKKVNLTFDLSALNSDAHITDAYYVLIGIKKGKLADTPLVQTFYSINYSEVIPAMSSIEIYLPIPTYLMKADTFAIAFNFDYKSKGDQKQKPLRKAYTLTLKSLPTIETTASYQFGMIGEYLKKFKIWPKLYDL